MKFDVNWLTLILAFIVAASGWLVWWIDRIQNDKRLASQRAAEAAKKEYAAERDFNHIKNNMKQMGDAISNGFDGLEERFNLVDRELLRLQSYFIGGKIGKNHDDE